MEQHRLLIISILTFAATGVSSGLQCYKCHAMPPPGHNYSTTNLCEKFDQSSKYVVDCPHSTMCMKQDIHLQIPNGVKINCVVRDCAPQKHVYQVYKNNDEGGERRGWHQRMDILEPYSEGCQDVDDQGQRTASSRYCYCRSGLCNSSPSGNSEGYTDIMGVIVVFNLMKYINSLRQ